MNSDINVEDELVELVEEKAEVIPFSDELIAKLPKKLQEIVRLPNWRDDEKMFDDPPSTLCPNMYCLQSTVRDGDMLLAWENVDPKIFGPGLHNLRCRWWTGLRHLRTVSVRDDLIEHGPLKIITVNEGKLGFGTEKGKNILFGPGRHMIRSNEFKWIGYLDLTKDSIMIGEWQLIRVDFGRVGVATTQGKMQVLWPGMYLFEPPDLFLRFVNTRVQTLKLPECVQESSDYVSLKVKANLSYYIKNPLLCIEQIQDQQAEKIIMEVANSAIAAIIRSSTLGDMAMKHKLKVGGADLKIRNDGEPGSTEGVEGEAFHEKMHTRFMSTVGDQLLNTMGIEVVNINIETLRIVNKSLAKQISSQAVKIAELESQHKTLEKEGVVKREQAKIELEVAEANAQAEYVVSAKRAEALKVGKLAKAEAEYEASKLRGQAKVELIKMKADCELEAYIKRSQAEYEHAQGMNKSELSKKLALINAQLDGVKVQAKAMRGLKQIFYVPHLAYTVDKAKNGIITSMKELTGVPVIPKLISQI